MKRLLAICLTFSVLLFAEAVYGQSTSLQLAKCSIHQELELKAGATFLPGTDDNVDFGSSTMEWNDGYFDGIIYTDDLYIDADDGVLALGASQDAQLLWSDGDASNHTLVLALDNTGQQMHITDVGAKATDWARSAGTHPELAIHSNTTPATDYLAIGNHDGTTATIEAVGGLLDLTAVGQVVINEAGADVNFRVEGDTKPSVLTVDAGDEAVYLKGDDVVLAFGAGTDFQLLWSDADASNHAAVIAVGDTSQQVHITDVGAKATDWVRSAGTHPEVAIHSNTTPATQYIALGNYDGVKASLSLATAGEHSRLLIESPAKLDPRESWEFFYDFNEQALVEADSPFILNAGTDDLAVDPAVVVAERGTIFLDAGDDDGTVAADASQLVLAVPVQADSGGLVIEARLHIEDITGCSVNVGLTDSSAREEPFSIAGGTVTSVATDAVCFCFDDGATTKEWYMLGVDGDTEATGNAATGTAPVNGTYQTFRIEIDADGEGAEFFIADASEGSLTANVCAASTNLYFTVIIVGDGGNGAAVGCTVDYVYVAHTR